MENILTRKITSKRTIKAVLIAVGMGIGFIVFGGIMLLSLYLGDKYIYNIFYTQIFQEPVWYIFLSLVFVVTSLLGILLVFKVNKHKTNNKSFTLIELLVVIAIIGVLAAIVITTISNAVTKSRIVRLQVFSDTIRAQLSDSLVSWWSFNEGSGTDAKDMWEGNDGTLVGDPEWKSGGECVSGSCLEFDGENDYIRINNFYGSNWNQITIEWWMALAINTASEYFFHNPRNNNGCLSLWRQASGYEKYLNVEYGYGTGVYVWSGRNILLLDNAFHHYVTVWDFDDSRMSIYRDGEYKSAITLNRVGNPALPPVEGTGFDIGRYYNGSGNWAGSLDEVRIYNSAVSITQVQSQYLAGLDKLLSNGAISKSEYNQRIKELSKEIVIE